MLLRRCKERTFSFCTSRTCATSAHVQNELPVAIVQASDCWAGIAPRTIVDRAPVVSDPQAGPAPAYLRESGGGRYRKQEEEQKYKPDQNLLESVMQREFGECQVLASPPCSDDWEMC